MGETLSRFCLPDGRDVERDLVLARSRTGMQLTEANIRTVAGGADDEEKMSQLCSRAQELSMLLGKVNALMDDCPSDTVSRPPSTRPTTNHSRPGSSRPAPERPDTGRPLTGSVAPTDKAPPMMLRLTTGRTEGKPSAIDRFLSGSGGMRPSISAPEAVETLRLYDEGRRVAALPATDESARDPADPCAVKHVRYVGRQSATGHIQRLRRNDDARAAQSSVADLVFGGGDS